MGTTITVLEGLYAARVAQFNAAANALTAKINQIGGQGAPGAIPTPPANPNNQQAMAAWIQAWMNWLDVYVAWYNSLSAEQKAEVQPLFQAANSEAAFVNAHYLALRDAKESQVGVEQALAYHCTYHNGGG